MKKAISTCCGLLALATLMVATPGCNESPGVSDPLNVNSNTNWLLACSDDVDCSEESACYCGQCTTPCEGDSDCEIVGGGVCTSQADRGDFCSTDPGSLCLPACLTDDECGSSYLCIDYVCEPAWSAPAECELGERVCGATLGTGADNVLECQNGEYVIVDECDGTCLANPGVDAACVDDCASGIPEAICASELGIGGAALFNCGPNNRYALMNDCAFGCVVQDGTDACGGQP